MYAIVNWHDENSILPVVYENGETMLFDTVEEAENYAREELNFTWSIIKVF